MINKTRLARACPLQSQSIEICQQNLKNSTSDTAECEAPTAVSLLSYMMTSSKMAAVHAIQFQFFIHSRIQT